eukprot:scaffold28403_cov66-Skeletonema_marinoi.AAC.1
MLHHSVPSGVTEWPLSNTTRYRVVLQMLHYKKHHRTRFRCVAVALSRSDEPHQTKAKQSTTIGSAALLPVVKRSSSHLLRHSIS